MTAHTAPVPVTNAVAGTSYQFAGDLESGLSGETVCVILKELAAGTTTVVGSAQRCLVVTSAWQTTPTTSYQVKTSGRTVFEDAPEEGEAWSTPAMQGSPLRPPEDVLLVQIGLTVTNVSAIDGPYPEAMNHFLG